MKYHIHSISSDITEDSFEHGEGKSTGCGLPFENICVDVDGVEGVIKYLAKHYGLSDDVNDYDFDGDRIDTSRMVADHSHEQNGGWMEPTPQEIESWNAGKMKLYSENYVIEISAKDELREIADELASKLEAKSCGI